MAGVLYLKSGREKSVLQRHPWIFSGSIDHIEEEPGQGETVEIRAAASGKFLARAAYSPFSQIRARIWTWKEDEEVNAGFLHGKLTAAIAARESLMADSSTTACRLVHAESDGLPGVVVDRYGSVLVLQCLTTGAEFWRDVLAKNLEDITGCRSIYERSDVDVRALEGLMPHSGMVSGEEVPERFEISENGYKFLVDVKNGHKTGFYLDQRRNRKRLQDFARGKSVLNCFSYTGGFSVYALAAGAEMVVSVDSSADALALGRENLRLNGLDESRARWEEADVFAFLRGQRDRAAKYDLIVLDPPRFAPTISQAERAARAYKDINLLAFKLLNPGGTLFTFSCSGGVSADLFQKIVAGAALDAGVDARIIDRLQQGEDHPVALNFPEGAYLKGLVCRVIN